MLSREALKRFQKMSTDSSSTCSKTTGAEDVELAKCLRKQGVYPGKSLDENNRELFHPLPFTHHFGGSFPDWMYQYAENPLQKVNQLVDSLIWIKKRFSCFSSRVTIVAVIIAFHFIMYLLRRCISWIFYFTKLDHHRRVASL